MDSQAHRQLPTRRVRATPDWGPFGSQQTKQQADQQKVRNKEERRQELVLHFLAWPTKPLPWVQQSVYKSSVHRLPEGVGGAWRGHWHGWDGLRPPEQAIKVEAKTEGGAPRARTLCVISTCVSARNTDQARNRLACSITTPGLAQARSAGCHMQHTARAPLAWVQHIQSPNRRGGTKTGVLQTAAGRLLKRRYGCTLVQQPRQSAKHTPQRGQVRSTPPKRSRAQHMPQTRTNKQTVTPKCRPRQGPIALGPRQCFHQGSAHPPQGRPSNDCGWPAPAKPPRKGLLPLGFPSTPLVCNPALHTPRALHTHPCHPRPLQSQVAQQSTAKTPKAQRRSNPPELWFGFSPHPETHTPTSGLGRSLRYLG